MSKPLKYIVRITGLTLPVILCAWYIHSYATNGVWQDEWSFVEYLKKFESGNYDLAGLFQYQHNEHKLFIPSLLLILVAHVCRYDGVAIQYVGLAIICLTCGILLTMSLQRVRQYRFAEVLLLPVLLLGFSLRQWENLICCFPYSILSVSLLFIVTTFLLDSLPASIWCLGGGLLSALCCTYSYGNGLLVWPLGLFQLLFTAYFLSGQDRKTALRAAVVWALCGALVLASYFSNYAIRKSFAGYLLFEHVKKEPSVYGHFFVDSLAIPLTGDQDLAWKAGLTLSALLITTLILFAKRTYVFSKQSAAPTSLLLFGLISTVLIFLGRSGMGGQAILCSRYASLTNLWIIGFYLLLVTGAKVPSLWSRANLVLLPLGFLAALTVFGYVISFQKAQAEGDRIATIRLVAANKLLNYKIESDESLMDILPFPKFVRLFAPYLETCGYSVFDKRIKIRTYRRNRDLCPPYCQFDTTGITKEEPPGWAIMTPGAVTYEVAKFSGWLIDSGKPQQRLAKFFIVIDGAQEFEAACGLYRPDVAEHFHRYENSYKYSGFNFVCRPDILTKGRHTVSIRTIANDGEEYISPELSTFAIH